MIELPEDGWITREVFEGLPALSHGWAWQLWPGRLELAYAPVGVWSWQVITRVLNYWQPGHQTAGNQYVADDAFTACLLAEGIVFAEDHRPSGAAKMHTPDSVYLALITVADQRQEEAASVKLEGFRLLGIPRVWIIRYSPDDTPDNGEPNGMILMGELHDQRYVMIESRLVSQLS